MMVEQPCGLWSLVIINFPVFIIFALSFAGPQPARDRRPFGAFPAFLVALFTEMYGFPLSTICCRNGFRAGFPTSIPFPMMPAVFWRRS